MHGDLHALFFERIVFFLVDYEPLPLSEATGAYLFCGTGRQHPSQWRKPPRFNLGANNLVVQQPRDAVSTER